MYFKELYMIEIYILQ